MDYSSPKCRLYENHTQDCMKIIHFFGVHSSFHAFHRQQLPPQPITSENKVFLYGFRWV